MLLPGLMLAVLNFVFEAALVRRSITPSSAERSRLCRFKFPFGFSGNLSDGEYFVDPEFSSLNLDSEIINGTLVTSSKDIGLLERRVGALGDAVC